ncbi:DUF308 domain-containing protein [Blastococcus capsensis]|uniref:DUF308 domain-containing protein n=1 Tax=Blastococcus capsensis TaxID=1564163 RepID=UPI002540F9E3|nr:DUF308 domain-containing protein [Blastococcus capsensis]MDK3255929.1 DUF308 domain-containing protein [Blastococcus capsensis]
MTGGSGRGRRDNGLRATLWSPVRDVDPRVGEHLLDVLEAAGIAAYLEPSADVAPYTRSVFLPSPPSDRLFVDRARRAEARGLVDQYADEHPVEPRVVRQAGRPAVDEDAEWRRIVAAFEAEHGPGPGAGTPVDTPPPAPHEIPILDRPDEHYEPPPPPPLPVPAPAALYAVLLVVAGILLVGAPSVLGLSADTGLVLGVVVIAGGVALLVSRMGDRSADDGDDGAVV